MNSLAIGMITIFLMISAGFIFTLYKLNSFEDKNQSLIQVSSLTKLPGISLSSSYLENRVTRYEDNSNSFYLGMKKNNYTSFVYEK